MNWKQILKKVSKSLAAILGGALIGGILAELYTLYIWLPLEGPKIGLGIIGLIVPIMILFGLMGIVTGAVLGLMIYWIYKYFKK